jgi:hypothetical protein
MEDANELCEMAIVFLRQGNEEAAMPLFRAAFSDTEMYNCHLAGIPRTHRVYSTPSSYSSRSFYFRTPYSNHVAGKSVESVHIDENPRHAELFLEIDQGQSPANSFHLFNRALRLSDDFLLNHELKQNQRLQKTVTAIIVLFNLGLIYHRVAIRNQSQEAFAEAEKLYTQCLRFIQRVALFHNLSDKLNMPVLCVFNDLGHIHSNFCQVPESTNCRYQMLLAFLATDCSRYLTEEEYLFFYLDLLLAPAQTLATAA